MHKNPVVSRFIIASPKSKLKPPSKDITAIFKLLDKKYKKYLSINRIKFELKRFLVFHQQT